LFKLHGKSFVFQYFFFLTLVIVTQMRNESVCASLMQEPYSGWLDQAMKEVDEHPNSNPTIFFAKKHEGSMLPGIFVEAEAQREKKCHHCWIRTAPDQGGKAARGRM